MADSVDFSRGRIPVMRICRPAPRPAALDRSHRDLVLGAAPRGQRTGTARRQSSTNTPTSVRPWVRRARRPRCRSPQTAIQGLHTLRRLHRKCRQRVGPAVDGNAHHRASRAATRHHRRRVADSSAGRPHRRASARPAPARLIDPAASLPRSAIRFHPARTCVLACGRASLTRTFMPNLFPQLLAARAAAALAIAAAQLGPCPRQPPADPPPAS